jgi:hypothetical protein
VDLWIPISTDCICSRTVALYIISMKELTLINRYHQTQERPKSSVEQRVKVMDTLDKKMQTILEREDLSVDERLKLYDQSFTRYLNVYDDYRPRFVAVAPEPVKQCKHKLYPPKIVSHGIELSPKIIP